jgi:hypothetical protein
MHAASEYLRRRGSFFKMKTDQANTAFVLDLSKANPLARYALVFSLVELPNQPSEIPNVPAETPIEPTKEEKKPATAILQAAVAATPTTSTTGAEEHFEPVTVRHRPTRQRLREMDVDAAIDRLWKPWAEGAHTEVVFTATEAASILHPLNRRDVAQLVAEGLLVNEGGEAVYKIPFESIHVFLERLEMAGLSQVGAAVANNPDQQQP